MPFLLKPKQTIVFIGDSITDCGRVRHEPSLGGGYVSHIADLIAAKYPAHQLNIINRGIGGNAINQLHDRWTDDVIYFKPDWVSIKIGINDLHRYLKFDGPEKITPEMFEDFYEKILTRTTEKTRAKIVLVDPFYISRSDDPDSFRTKVLKTLTAYHRVVAKMARKYKTRHVKTHEAFKTQLKYTPTETWCPEPVHPNKSGHLIIAYQWLKSMNW